MNNLNLNETTLDLFESYTKNQLNEKEKASFNEQLAQDPSFNSNFQSFLLSKAVINEKIEASLRDQMKQWGQGYVPNHATDGSNIVEIPHTSHKVKKMNWSRWAAAASFLFLLVSGTIQYNNINKFPQEQLNEQVALVYEVPRSEANVSSSRININKIISSLGTKRDKQSLEKAISELSAGNSLDENYKTAQKFIGELYTHLGNWAMAEKAFQNSNASEDLKQRSHLLAMLKSKDTGPEFQKKLDDLINNPNSSNNEIANKLKRKTNSFWWKIFN